MAEKDVADFQNELKEKFAVYDTEDIITESAAVRANKQRVNKKVAKTLDRVLRRIILGLK
jgi:hypothetical protein